MWQSQFNKRPGWTIAMLGMKSPVAIALKLEHWPQGQAVWLWEGWPARSIVETSNWIEVSLCAYEVSHFWLTVRKPAAEAKLLPCGCFRERTKPYWRNLGQLLIRGAEIKTPFTYGFSFENEINFIFQSTLPGIKIQTNHSPIKLMTVTKRNSSSTVTGTKTSTAF